MYYLFVLLACALVAAVAREVLPHTSHGTTAGFVGLGLAGGFVTRGYAGVAWDGLSFDLHFASLARAGPGAILVVALLALALMRRARSASAR